MIVPSTPFVSAASAAMTSESFSAATASRDETTSQNPPAPFSVDDQTSGRDRQRDDDQQERRDKATEGEGRADPLPPMMPRGAGEPRRLGDGLRCQWSTLPATSRSSP